MAVLDMGCGSAHSFPNLRECGVAFTGIDVSQVQIDRNMLRYGEEATFYAHSLYSSQLESESFDLVFSTYVIEHLVWPHKFLREVARLVRPNGMVVILCPHFRVNSRIPSLEYGTEPRSLRERMSKLEAYGSLRHLWLRNFYYPRIIRAEYPRSEYPFLINLRPSCFRGTYYIDNDAVYFTDRREMVTELARVGVVDVTARTTQNLRITPKPESCMIVGRKLS